MFSRLPYSLWWFAAALVVFLLQVFPLTGIFLMFLAAPLWVGVLVTIGMVSLAIESLWHKGVSLLWFALPVAYVVGYALAYGYSSSEFSRLEGEVDTANGVPAIPFDPVRDSLLISAQRRGEAENLAEQLVRSYGVGRVYSVEARPRGVNRRLYGIAPANLCNKIASNKAAWKLGAGTFPLNNGDRAVQKHGAKRPGLKPDSHCGYWIEQSPGPDERPVRIEIASSDTKTWQLGRLRWSTATLTRPDGSTRALKSGSGSPLAPWPFLMAGCFLNSGAPSWDCDFGFMRTGTRGFGSSSKYDPTIAPVLVAALGLSKTDRAKNSSYPDGIEVALDENYLDRQLDKSVDKVRDLIGHPEIPKAAGNLNEYPGLEENPDRVTPLVPAIVAELVRRIDANDASRANTWILQRLLAAQSDAVLSANLQPYLDRLENADRNGFRQLNLELVKRLDAVGPGALAVLKRKFAEPQNTSRKYALFAICRLGPQARALAEDIRAIALDDKRRSRIRVLLHATALSIGETELAAQMRAKEPDARFLKVYDKALVAARTGDRDRLCLKP